MSTFCFQLFYKNNEELLLGFWSGNMLSQVSLNTTNPIYHKKPAVSNRPQGTSGNFKQVESSPSFTGGVGNYIKNPLLAFNVLPKIDDQTSKQMFMDLYSATNAQGKADLKFLLDTGKLLSADADDGSTTLYNLHRIIKEPRAQGLDSKDILNSALRALANPFSITQNFGKLSPAVTSMLLNNAQSAKLSSAIGVSFAASPKRNLPVESNAAQQVLPAEYNVTASGTCVAASMEFDLADKRPAEFARYAADLSSPKMAVLEEFKFSDIDEDQLAAMYWLEQFQVQYDSKDMETGYVVLKPDEAAIYRAISQTQQREPGSRSALNVLMQSAFMQLGSAHSYNSLNDIRTGGFNQSDRGLTEFEKSFAEAIVDDNGGKSSVTYQIVDDNAFLVGYNKTFQETLMDIINSLKSGFNVIVGITETDANAQITGGHEITIVASKVGQDGRLYFICNDTDNDMSTPVEILADELIPKIHHAGIPNVVLKQTTRPVAHKPIIIQKPPQINPHLSSVAAQNNTLAGVNMNNPSPGFNLLA